MSESPLLIEALDAVPHTDVGGFSPLTLELRAGEMVYLLGPEQWRIRYYLRMVAGLEPAEKGESRLGVSEGRLGKSIDYVDSSIPLLSILNGRENVRLPALYHNADTIEAIEERLEWLLGLIDYPADHNVLPAYMSMLQRRHLALARGVMLQPEVLVAADPFAALNSIERQQVVTFLMAQQAEGMAVVVSSDYPELAYQSATAIVFVGEGCCCYFEDWLALLASDHPAVVSYVAYHRQCSELFSEGR